VFNRTSWANWDEFERDVTEETGGHPLDIFRALCPPWVFGDTDTTADVLGLLRYLCDHLQDPDPNSDPAEIGRRLLDAAEEVERLQATGPTPKDRPG
jgi:hypothetical protein